MYAQVPEHTLTLLERPTLAAALDIQHEATRVRSFSGEVKVATRLPVCRANSRVNGRRGTWDGSPK